MDTSFLEQTFAAEYGRAPRLFRAPGRVNLIGEHTDYNDGFVLPMPLDRETVVAASARDDRNVRVRSLNRGEAFSFNLDSPGERRRGSWLNYVEGVAWALERRGYRLRGINATIQSDIPEGAGLSSSAALEISFGLALLSIADRRFDPTDLARAGQTAEHEFVGTKCGIMDQFVAVYGRRGNALFLDCRDLTFEHVPIDDPDVKIVVCHSGVKHELAGTAYNQRRDECRRGVELLRAFLPGISSLRDVGADEFAAVEHALPDPVRRRCRHVVTENERVVRSVAALHAGDFQTFGTLMTQSHASLRDDFEVSCKELDALTETALGIDGVLGARMTGGGFGGCTVNLVRSSRLDDFLKILPKRYAYDFGIRAETYVLITKL